MTTRLPVLAGAWVAGLLAMGAALWVLIESDQVENTAATASLVLIASFSFVTTGLIALWRRPENRTGLLMAATGYAWLPGALQFVSNSWLFTIGVLLSGLAWGPFAHLILAYPTGRLQRRSHVWFVVATYALVLGEGLVLLLVDGTEIICDKNCPESAIAIWHSDDAAGLIAGIFTVVALGIIGIALMILVRRWRAATPALRRALGWVFLTSGATLTVVVVATLVDTVSDRWSLPFQYAAFVGLALVPLSFLAGVLRSRLARSAAGDVLLELSEGASLRDALARALHDPSLEVAYWLPESERYVDTDGRTFREDIGEGRSSKQVERDGRRIAMLVHDATLEDEPELVEAVAAAAGLWLENERLQADMRAQYTFLLTVVHTAPSLLVTVDTDGYIRNFNTAVETTSGLDDPEQIRGRPFWEVFFDPTDREAIQKQFRDAAPDFEPSEYENAFTNARGERKVIQWTSAPLRDEDGDVVRIIAGGIDITERKRQEVALRGSEDRLRAAIESSPVAIVEIDLESHITRWNPAAEQMFGWTEEEARSGPLPMVPEDRLEEYFALVAQVRAGHSYTGHETVRLRKDGTPVDVAIASAPIRDMSGATIGHMAIFADITERKRQERALRASEERRRAAIEASPVAIVELDFDRCVAAWNPAAEQMFGWAAEEVVGRPVPYVPEPNTETVVGRFERVLEGESFTNVETLRRRKDGSVLDVEVSSAPIRGSDGEVVGVMAIFTDISERKQREAALEASEERRRATIEASPVAIVEIGTDERVAAWNRAAEQIFGWTADEVLGQPMPINPPEYQAELEALIAKVKAGTTFTGYETIRQRKDGSRIDVEISSAPLRDETGRVVGRMAMFADISERKQREAALKASEERRRATIEASPVAIVEVDTDERVAAWNPAAEEIFGWTADEIVGKPLPFVPDGYHAELEELIERVRSGVTYTGYETVRKRRDGTLFPVEVSSAPLRDPAGEVVGRMALFNDITERRERDDALRTSEERLRAVIDSSPVAIVEMGFDDRVISWNSAAERMFGWTAEEVVGDALRIVAPGDEEVAEELNDRVHRGDVIFGFEAVRLHKDGRAIPVEISGAPLRDSTGEVVNGMAIYVDVSERKHRERALRESEERLRAAIGASPVAIVELDVDQRVLMWNTAAERMFGWETEEVVGKPLPIVPDDRRREYEGLVQRVRNGEVFAGYETVRRTKDGRPVEVEISSASIRDPAGEVRRYMTVYVDIAERKRRELELKVQRDFANTLADTIPVLTAVVDESATFAEHGVNPAFEQAMRVTAADVAGMSFLDFIEEEDRYLALMAIASAANGVPSNELESNWGGQTCPTCAVAWTARPIIGLHGRLVLVTGVDITDRRRQEEELRASRARLVEAGDEARRRLERNLHDGAQQRLVALSVSLRLAEAKLASDPGGAGELLTGSREELARAIDELRELARGIHPAVLTDRGLAAALEGLTSRTPLPVEVELPDERLPAPVEAAAYYLVAEALTNVAKYAGATSATVAVTRLDGTLTVEVADDGVGGADPGTGSGLRGLADRVAALDGTLTVDSPPGKGTRVRAEIPVREPALSK